MRCLVEGIEVIGEANGVGCSLDGGGGGGHVCKRMESVFGFHEMGEVKLLNMHLMRGYKALAFG